MISPPALAAAAAFLVSFAGSKLAAFAGPLLVSQLLHADDYGAVELALSIGMPVALLLSTGLPAAATQAYLVEQTNADRHLATFSVATGTAALLASVLAWTAGSDLFVATCLAFVGLSAAQLGLSAYCRMRGLRVLTGWADNLALITMTGVAVIVWLAAGRLAPGELYLGMAIALGVIVASAALARVRMPATGDRSYRDVARIGLPMMLNGLMLYLANGSQRLIVGVVFGLFEVAAYALCSRFSLVLILIHQTISTALFVQIYRLPSESIDRWFSKALAGYAMVAFVLSLAVRHWAGELPFRMPVAEVVALFPLVASQTVLWIGTALLELPSNREGTAGASVKVTLGISAGAALLIWGMHAGGSLTLARLCLLFDVALLAILLGQVALLRQRGISFRRTLAVAPLALTPALLSWSALT